jgi:hypothetical protein
VAITLVGTFSGQDDTGATVTVSLTGTASGDVVYAFQATRHDEGAAPTGYTQLVGLGDDFSSTSFYAYRKVLSAADASVVFAAGLNEFGNACTVVVLRGVNNTTPEDATTTTDTGTTSAIESPPITTATANAWVLTAYGSLVSSPGILAPSGYSDQIVITSHNDEVGCGVARKEIASPGVESPGQWDTNPVLWVAASIAVRPAAAGLSGGLFSNGVAAASFAGRSLAGGAMVGTGAGLALFVAQGGSSAALTAGGSSEAFFEGSSTGGTRPELPGLVPRAQRSSVLFRSRRSTPVSQ